MRAVFAIVLSAFFVACSVAEDDRTNTNDPKYGSSGSSSGVDLAIATFNTSATYNDNQQYSLSVTVSNSGKTAAGSFTVAIYTGASTTSLNYALAYSSSFAGKTIVSSLAAGASTTVAISLTPLFTFHGLIGAYADTTETVTETNETNNYKINNVIIQ